MVAFEEQLARDFTRKGIAKAEGDEVHTLIDLPVRKTAAGVDLDEFGVRDEVVVSHIVAEKRRRGCVGHKE
jgi:hypothetical protein